VLKPPLTLRVWPVMASDSGPAKNAAALAMSCSAREQHALAQVLDHALAVTAFERWRARAPARLGIPDVAHRHRVDPNAVAPQFTRQHAAHLHHAGGGAANEGFADRGHAARVGAHRDDLAAARAVPDAGGSLINPTAHRDG